jgi:hypothetical protein
MRRWQEVERLRCRAALHIMRGGRLLHHSEAPAFTLKQYAIDASIKMDEWTDES